MRELGVLLAAYLESHYPDASEPDKAAFRKLLELADPDLINYLLGSESPADPEIASVVSRIRGKASA